jgi:hypothetical protein
MSYYQQILRGRNVFLDPEGTAYYTWMVNIYLYIEIGSWGGLRSLALPLTSVVGVLISRSWAHVI